MTPVLSIETSGELCSVAIMLNETNFSEFNYLQKNIHSEKIIGMIDALLNTSGLSIKDIKTIAVSNGPGSFTGLRIGMTVAKSIAFGLNIPVIPVPTFYAAAYQLSEYLEEGQKFIIANKLNASEIYVAKFQTTGENFKILDEVRVINKSDFPEYSKQNFLIFGSYGNKNWVDLPNANFMAKWAYFFGKDLLTYNFDYIEPNYSKNFIPRIKK